MSHDRGAATNCVVPQQRSVRTFGARISVNEHQTACFATIADDVCNRNTAASEHGTE